MSSKLLLQQSYNSAGTGFVQMRGVEEGTLKLGALGKTEDAEWYT